jgi:hypothetical protein
MAGKNIWAQSPVDIFEFKPPKSSPQPSITIPVSLSDTSPLQSITESGGEPIILPPDTVLPIRVDPSSEGIQTISAVGSCKTVSIMNILLSVIFVILLTALIVIGVKKYIEYQKPDDNEQEEDLESLK